MHLMIFMFFVVVLSVAVSIYAEVQGTGDGVGYYIFDVVTFAIFFMEMICRMWALNSAHAFFTDPLCIVDFIVVLLDIITFAAKEALGALDGFTKALRVIRLARLGRLLRMARLVSKLHFFSGTKVSLEPHPPPRTSSAHLFHMTEPDEHVGPISIETYMGVRVKAVKRVFERRSPQVSNILNTFEIMGFVVTSSGSILAIVGYTEWVVLTVLMTTIIKNGIAAAGWRPELAALNAGLLDIQNLCVWWESLTIGDRGTRATKEHCVSTIECALQNVTAAKTVNVEEKGIDEEVDAEGPPKSEKEGSARKKAK